MKDVFDMTEAEVDAELLSNGISPSEAISSAKTAVKAAMEKFTLGKLDIHFQSQFQETPSGVKVSSTLLRKLRGIDISEDHERDIGEMK